MPRWLSSSGAAGIATLLSRILGFARESAYAAFMGTGPVADAFFLAFQIPNLLRRLLGEGALSAAFIPVFKETERNQGHAAAWRVGVAFIWSILLATSVICLVLGLFLTCMVTVSNVNSQTELMFRLMRWMLPYLPMVCVAAALIGMLNARRIFFLPALGATMLNATMLGSIWFLAPRFGSSLETQIFGLALGVVVAGFLQLAFQVPSLWKEGFRFHWLDPRKEPAVHEIARRMGPSILGVAAFQISTVLCQTLAYSHGDDLVSSFNYAIRLMELPQGVVGISLATVLLPELSDLAADKKFPEFRSTLSEGLRQVFFLTLLPAIILLVLSEPIVRLLFERGEFKPHSTGQVAFMLACLTPGLLAFSLNNILARAFFALGDTATPMRISLVAIGVNVVTALFSLGIYPRAGLAIANSLSGLVNCILLFYAIKRAQPKFDIFAFRPALLRMLIAALAAAVVAFAVRFSCTQWIGHSSLLPRLAEVFIPIAFAALTYGAVAFAVGLGEIRDVINALRRRHPITVP